MMADNAGQQLGNYRLLHLIGEGGFARVYLGEHIYLKTYGALKVPKMHLNQEDLDAFLAEARRSVSLEHPHIVRVLECGVEGGTIPYFVMNYAPGGTVRRRYPKDSRLPPAIIFSYVRQIASALQYIHHKGLIHQDIKPENMLLGPHDEVLLSDFGISAVAHRTVTMSVQEVTGTARYMAPEQFQGIVRPASDQYALGVVVYEWICGTSPFNGTFAELYSQHLYVDPPSLREKVPEISPALEQVIMRALAKDPRQRFARIQDFMDALDQARQAPQMYSQTGHTFVPTLPDSNVQQDEENIPTVLRAVPVSPGSRPPGATPVPPGPPIADDEEDIPTVISGGHRAIQITNGQKAVQEKGSSKKKHRGPSRRMVVLLVGLVIIVVAGSVAFFVNGLRSGRSGAHTSSHKNLPTTPSVPPPYSPMFGFNLEHTHYNPLETILNTSNVSQLVPYWTMTTSSYIYSSPLVANGLVYIASTDNKLYAFNAATGQSQWQKSIGLVTGGGAFIYSSPAVVNGVVYIGSNDHNLYAFNATTGTLLWTAPTGGFIYSSPAIDNGKVYIGSTDHKLYAFNAVTGTKIWVASTGGQIYASPAVVKGIVYIGSNDHKLYALDANTGNILWTAPTHYNINSSPAVVDGVVYTGSDDGNMYAFDASGCGGSTCQPLWVVPTGDYIFSSPAVVKNTVYIGSHDGKLYAFDASACANGPCSPLWTATTGDGIVSSPTVANGVVYVGSWDGKVYAFDGSTGTKLWSYPTGDRIYSSPTVINGVVYIGSTDHKLYAFHLPGSS
jgi:outer membrane protein assembly factor BamB/tRNA A-37 threonylcarbamoyl transferase component Bud32